MSETFPQDVNYDAFINLDRKDVIQQHYGSSIHIVLENKAMSEVTLKLIESDLQEIFSNLLKESTDEINEKKPDSEQVASYGKIRFSLDGLNLKADEKEKLLRKLYHYAGRKGLHEFKESNSTGKE